MVNVDTAAGWGAGKSEEISRFCSEILDELRNKRLKNGSLDLALMMERIEQSEYTDADKKWMCFVIGVWFGRFTSRRPS